MEIIVTGPPPGAPSPLPEHVELLNEVIAILGSADLLTKEAITGRRASDLRAVRIVKFCLSMNHVEI